MRLVVFPFHTVDKLLNEGFRTRDAHLIQELDRHPDVERVDIVERPVTLPELAARRRPRPGRLRRDLAASSALTKTSLATCRATKVVRPVLRGRAWWEEAYRPSNLVRRDVERVRRLVGEADVVLSFVPTAHPLWAGHPRVAQDLLDNWLVHPQLGERSPTLVDDYRASLAGAALVTANADGTAELARSLGHTPTVVYNGVDGASFRRSGGETAAAWQDTLARLPRPWLVYAGKLQQRLDVDLVVRLAQETSGSVVLAGPVLDEGWVGALRALPNVHFMGDIHYRRLPGLLVNADVALVPHRVGPGEVGGDALKVYEYCALGVRVVCTHLSGWERYATFPGVTPCPDASAFVARAVEAGIDSRTVQERLRDARLPADTEWSHKAQLILDTVRSVR